MANPGMPTPDTVPPMPGEPVGPLPGGILPTDVPPSRKPDEMPDIGPTGPRTPYPVDDPGITDPTGPGSEPDYLPPGPTDPGIRL